MTILRDDDPRFRNLSRKIGVFVLVALAGIVLTVVAIGLEHEVFTPKTRIHFITDSGQDIAAGMPVKLSGFAIGKVERLALTDTAAVKVTLVINNAYMKWVRQDSRARLLKEGLIGTSVIEILPGSGQAKPLAANQPIPFDRSVGIGRMIDELRGEIVPLIQDLRRIARYIDDPNGDVKQALKRTSEFVASLQGTQKKLDTLLANANADLPPMLRSGREAVEGGKKVVDSLQRTWPISNNIEAPKAGVVPLDSYDGAAAPLKPSGSR